MSNAALALVQKGSQGDLLIAIAKDEGIPASGLTILGGKPYVNTTGLDVKLQSKCNQEKLVHVSTEYVEIQKATKENGTRAGGWGIVKLFDKPGFEKALMLASKGGPVTRDVIDSLKELYFRVYKMRGFASPETLQMSTMKCIDNIEAMAERRATNRAKREATGTGLTSVDEMDENGDRGLPDLPIDQGARELMAERAAEESPATEGAPFLTDCADKGGAYISRDQCAALKKTMEEFRLSPADFGAILTKELGHPLKGTSFIRKPEYQTIIKLFQGVRDAKYTLSGGKLLKPEDIDALNTQAKDEDIPF